jgi:hypothetical protein
MPDTAPAEERPPRAHDLYDDEVVDESRLVRPYAVTGGRTRASRTDLPIEALVRGVSGAHGGGTPERRRILEMTASQILSIAELSAHLSLPIGVVRVLVADLADDDLVLVHVGAPTSTAAAPVSNLKLLESVLNGISAL